MTPILLIVLGVLCVAGALRVLPLRVVVIGTLLLLASSAPWIIDWVSQRLSAGAMHPTGAAITDLLLAGLGILVMLGLFARARRR